MPENEKPSQDEEKPQEEPSDQADQADPRLTAYELRGGGQRIEKKER